MTKRVLGPDGAITRLANKYFTQNAASSNEPSFQPDFASWQRKSTGHTCAFDLNATKEISSLCRGFEGGSCFEDYVEQIQSGVKPFFLSYDSWTLLVLIACFEVCGKGNYSLGVFKKMFSCHKIFFTENNNHPNIIKL